VYGEYSKSLAPKIVLTLLHAAALCVVYWLFFLGGFIALSYWTGRTYIPGAFLTRVLLFACAAIYFLRLLFGLFYLVRRTMRWGEAIGIGFFVFLVHIFFALVGGTNPRTPGASAAFGALLYLAGSYLNTASEFTRQLWKQKPENQGRLYTGGLFRYARHINYFGDGVLFTGYALITGSLWSFLVPAFMAIGFISANIPALDTYLARKYGDDFDAYALRTKKFIPFVY
jgi:protein-S-isoprenylcysteine O-methyltransferase Ste14